MVSSYRIAYARAANDEERSAIERLLTGLGSGPVAHDPVNRTFAVELTGDDTSAGLARVRTQLEPVSAQIVAVSKQREAKDLAVSQKWNLAFTNMIRESNQAAWGNWDLNTSIRAGAVGILNPETGSFTYVATIPNASILEDVLYQSWQLESSSVSFSESEVDFKGGYKDPSSGLEVKVGLDVAWSFASANLIVSRATLSGRSMVDNFGVLLDKKHEWDWMLAQAKSVNYANADGILQGFGLITSVANCIGGINIGSIEEKSTFSLVGSVDGVKAMTGGGEASAGVKGSYKEKKESKAFESRTWPVAHDSVAPNAGEVALSYQFASFNGKTIMPTWIGRIGDFTITFDNAHGGTYIGRCYVDYSIPQQSARVSRYTSVSGGRVDSIGGIPLDAYDLKIHVDFAAGGDSYFSVPSPLTEWLNGSCTIDLSGVWPWGSKAVKRAT